MKENIMFKAILYYLLMVAEFCVITFLGGFSIGIYLALSGAFDGKSNIDQQTVIQEGSTIILSFVVLAVFIVWFTFYAAKFSRLSLGRVLPQKKWKVTLWSTLPILGFTMTYCSLLSLLDIDLSSGIIHQMGYWMSIPVVMATSFISAYVIFGAILEELFKKEKKTWVVFVTYFVMSYLPMIISSFEQGVRWLLLASVLSIVQLVYFFWLYKATRSPLLILVISIVTDLVPLYIPGTLLPLALACIGGSLTLGGAQHLHNGELQAGIQENIN